MECLQLSQWCPSDSSDRKLRDEIERSAIISDSVAAVVKEKSPIDHLFVFFPHKLWPLVFISVQLQICVLTFLC